MEVPQKLIDNYETLSINGIPCNLGFGAYGSVQLGKCLKTKKTVAIKKIFRKLAVNEVDIHFSLSHPNIIRMLDFYFDQAHMTTFIVLQYAENGTLFDFVRQHGIKDKILIKSVIKSVCDALAYMHSKGIMHRDIKPENILLNKNYDVKLCDFGFAANVEPRMTLCGTVEYMSPEMMLRKKHDHKIDVWSIGILLFQLIEGHAPFQGQTQDQIIQKMKMPLFFSNKFVQEQIELIHKILKVDPKQRPQVIEILNDPYICHQQKRYSEQVSKRSTMQQQKESKIKIISVKEIPSQKDKNQKKHYSYNQHYQGQISQIGNNTILHNLQKPKKSNPEIERAPLNMQTLKNNGLNNFNQNFLNPNPNFQGFNFNQSHNSFNAYNNNHSIMSSIGTIKNQSNSEQASFKPIQQGTKISLKKKNRGI